MKRRQRGNTQLAPLGAAGRHIAAKRSTPLMQVFHLWTVRRWLEEWCRTDLIVGYRDIETIAEGTQRLLAHFLLRVGDVLTLSGLAHAITLYGLGQDDGRLALVAHRRCIGRINLARIMTSAIETPDVVIRQVSDHRRQLRVLAKEMLAHIGTPERFVGLVVAVDTLLHAL